MNLRVALTKLLFATVVFVFSTHSQAYIYQWKDEAGRVHYSDKQSAAKANVYDSSVTPSIPASVKLDVPPVKQGKNLCGPGEEILGVSICVNFTDLNVNIDFLFKYLILHAG